MITQMILNRYNKPSKEILIDIINTANNRNYGYDDIEFGLPESLNETGKTNVSLSFKDYPDVERTLVYYRINIQDLPIPQPMVIHTRNWELSVLEAILEQYALYLDEDDVRVEFVESDEEDNATYQIVVLDSHLLYTGSITVNVRPSMDIGGDRLLALIHLREYFLDSTKQRPPIELYLPNGEVYSTVESQGMALYSIKPNTYVKVEDLKEDYDKVTDALVELMVSKTSSPWIVDDSMNKAFNLHNAEVLYNGFSNEQYQPYDVSFNRILVLRLADTCTNFSGLLKIAYRYSPLPEQTPYNKASVLPLFK